MTMSAPTAVAAPLPPRKPCQTGKQCPTTAAKPQAMLSRFESGMAGNPPRTSAGIHQAARKPLPTSITTTKKRYFTTLAAKKLLGDFDVDVIICDDGLQHYALGRDIEIALVDGGRRYGNECLLPAGPLREGLWRLNTIDWIINNGGPVASVNSDNLNEHLMQLNPAPVCQVQSLNSVLLPPEDTDSQLALQQAPITAMAGIGNPQRFFDSLAEQGYQLKQVVAFADHQPYDKHQLIALSRDTPLLMTEKDAVKCRDFALPNWWYLPVNAKLSTEFDTQFMSRMTQLIQLKKEI